MEARRAVVLVMTPLPDLWRHVSRCLAPQGHVVLRASNVEEARRQDAHPDVIAIDGQLLVRCNWHPRELAETIEPDRRVPLLGLVRRDSHRPPKDLDLTRVGIVTLYEPFQAAELAMVVNWLGRRGQFGAGPG
jgi:hypothetical protein